MTGRRRPGPPLPPGTRPAPGYEILGHLARTGWLDVYDAWSEERACRCVLKVVRPDRRGHKETAERLLREGRWLREFSHPHLVRAYETVETPEPLVVLETLGGETLSHLIQRLERRPAATDVALLGVQLCSAVHYLHGRGLLHLDLKPSNVVVECGRAKVLDLSAARPPGPAPPGVGTFCYLAPEQARGGRLTAAADVWGIGVTLYEVACGDVPFDRGETVHDSETAHDTARGTALGGGGEGESEGEDGPVKEDEGAEPADAAREPQEAGQAGDLWYPQLEAAAPPIRSRRRLPRALAAAIDGCLRPDPADRPAVPDLAAALRTALPGRRG
ncbi:serine/threonine-protein kinase [Streptomyces mexicanus]|uniref:non-specific serine/threonine protein kinase n=1 Tax=Streptomyces mexicanus TaxID=178566 RepID=A0A7X1HVM9_9ACTN|nr:serine/threonine-protein kinase [Streptomyces mexicanus]MBC2863766.1 serine/threonine protein kinase [Streptomyces mexicanus]